MTDARSGERTWLRVVAEVVLVFLGILAAFSLESWRDDRGSLAYERVVIAGLITEFESTELMATELLSEHSDNASRFAELHRLLTSGEAVQQPDSVAVLADRLWVVWTMVPEMPVYENLLSSSGLGIIRSDSLRIALRRYELVASRNRRSDEFLAAFDEGLMLEVLFSRLPFSRHVFGDEADGNSGIAPSMAELADDLEFRNVISTRYAIIGDLITSRTDLIAETQNVLRLLRAEAAK